MNLQCTIEKPINFSGIGLHSGHEVNITIKPAPADNGITFVRADQPGHPAISARVDNVCSTNLCTTLGFNGTHVHTVEHILAAFNGMNVDNAIVEVDADEVPIMDGSAGPFVELIKRAGITVQGALRKYIMVKYPISIYEDDKFAVILPADKFALSYTIDFEHPKILKQSYFVQVSPQSFMQEISAARTFGFLKDVEEMHAHGLALGGSLDNAILLGESDIINYEGLRFPDEFVRHKMLDSLGDLALLGAPVIGHFYAHKSGHYLNTSLVRLILENTHCWEYVTSYTSPRDNFPSQWTGLRNLKAYSEAPLRPRVF